MVLPFREVCVLSAASIADRVVRPAQRFRLFSRLALLVVVPLLLLAVAAVINAEKEYQAAETTALETASVIARQAAARLDEHYDEQDQFLEALGEIARGTLTHGDDGDSRLRRLARAMPQHVNDLSILALDGSVLASTTADAAARARVNVADRAYFKDALAKRSLVVDEPLVSRTSNQ